MSKYIRGARFNNNTPYLSLINKALNKEFGCVIVIKDLNFKASRGIFDSGYLILNTRGRLRLRSYYFNLVVVSIIVN